MIIIRLGRSQKLLFSERYDYLSGELLGTGNGTAVLKVQDRCNGKFYAVKIIPCGSRYEEQKSSIHQEIQILRRLNNSSHPFRDLVVNFHRSYYDKQKREVRVVMSPVAEKSLEQLLDCGPAEGVDPCEDFSNMFKDLADGLSFIHEMSVRHKDIKPTNILLHGGRLIYTDFGISTCFDGQSAITNSTHLQGTFIHAAPEYVQDAAGHDLSTDIFCLGSVFYEILGRYVKVPQLTDTCFGGVDFRGYGAMVRDGVLLTQITRAKLGYPCSCLPCAKLEQKYQHHGPAHMKERPLYWDYLELILLMLSFDADLRPTASQLAATLEPGALRSLAKILSGKTRRPPRKNHSADLLNKFRPNSWSTSVTSPISTARLYAPFLNLPNITADQDMTSSAESEQRTFGSAQCRRFPQCQHLKSRPLRVYAGGIEHTHSAR